MLNELEIIRNGIIDVDESLLKVIHKEVAEPGKKNLIQVFLAPDDLVKTVDSVNILDGDKNKGFWTQGHGNHHQFPAVKLKQPLRRDGVEEMAAWKQSNSKPEIEVHLEQLRKLRDKYTFILDEMEDWPGEAYRNKLWEREKIYRGLNDESSYIHLLLKTFLELDPNQLLANIENELWQSCLRMPTKELLDISSTAMFSKAFEITLLFDIQIESHPSAASTHWKPQLSNVLYEHDKKLEKVNKKSRLGTCAITGIHNIKLVSDKFPQKKCNVVGNVSIYNRKKGVQTYKRYGHLAFESMPVSEVIADQLASALVYLNSSKKGVLWDSIPSESKGVDLLLAYCKSDTESKLIQLVTYEPESFPIEDEFEYEEIASEVIQSFKGKHHELSKEKIIDFVLIRKISDGVQKVIYSTSNSIRELDEAAKEWINACKNYPPVNKPLTDKKFSEFWLNKLPTISPKQFIYLSHKQYKKNLDSEKAPKLSFAITMGLFLNDRRINSNLALYLNKYFKQYANLLEHAASRKALNNIQIAVLRKAICALGLLLFKLGRTKEIYMKQFAFKLGQFCSVLDEIHIGYCASERKGDVPPRLIGNQTYSAALSNPLKALELAAQRSAVYIAWAEKNAQQSDKIIDEKKLAEDIPNKNQIKRNIKNAKYARYWLKRHCQELRELLSEGKPIQASTETKVELLLGYLSGREIIKKSDKSKGKNDSGNDSSNESVNDNLGGVN